MEYNKIGDWAIGYLEALSAGNSVSKQQLEKMISRIQDMIKEIERNNTENIPPAVVEEAEEF
jgi:hypothetical protein